MATCDKPDPKLTVLIMSLIESNQHIIRLTDVCIQEQTALTAENRRQRTRQQFQPLRLQIMRR